LDAIFNVRRFLNGGGTWWDETETNNNYFFYYLLHGATAWTGVLRELKWDKINLSLFVFEINMVYDTTVRLT